MREQLKAQRPKSLLNSYKPRIVDNSGYFRTAILRETNEILRYAQDDAIEVIPEPSH